MNTLYKVRSSNLYRPDRPLVMVTHGWMSSGRSNATQLIKNAYLDTQDVNIVVVDWQRDAANENYLSSATLTMLVAEKVSRKLHLLLAGAFFEPRHLLFRYLVGLLSSKISLAFPQEFGNNYVNINRYLCISYGLDSSRSR